jgi:hypothetical protein
MCLCHDENQKHKEEQKRKGTAQRRTRATVNRIDKKLKNAKNAKIRAIQAGSLFEGFRRRSESEQIIWLHRTRVLLWRTVGRLKF